MGILAPLEPDYAPYGNDSPIVGCESCGATGQSHNMINVMIACGSPGHPSIVGFQCPSIEHWSCSLECWLKVAHACIDEHIHVLLKDAHNNLGV